MIFTDKNKIIQILFGTAVLILIVYLIADKSSNINASNHLKRLTASEINVKFQNALRSFGLQKDWIEEVKYVDTKGKNVLAYLIKIPKDLPIPVILVEIFKTFDSTNVRLDSREKVMDGESLLKIYIGKKLELFANLEYDDGINRNVGSAGFLITGIEQSDKNEIHKFLRSPESFAAVLTPSKASVQFASQLTANRKEYVVELTDNINELNFQLRKNFSHYRLRNAIRAIIGNFSKAAFFIIDNRSEIYNSSAGRFIMNEFTKRRISLIPTGSIFQINTGNDKEIISRFDTIMHRTKKGDYKLIMIPAVKFMLLQPGIVKLRKKGYKFINPSIVIVNRK